MKRLFMTAAAVGFTALAIVPRAHASEWWVIQGDDDKPMSTSTCAVSALSPAANYERLQGAGMGPEITKYPSGDVNVGWDNGEHGHAYFPSEASCKRLLALEVKREADAKANLDAFR